MNRPDDLFLDSQPPPVATAPLDDVCDSPRDPKPKELVLWPRAVVAGILGFVMLVYLSDTFSRPHHKSPDQARAVMNARQIALALAEFRQEYGSYPGVESIDPVRQQFGTEWRLGEKTSNDLFRQLLAAEMVTDEGVFYAKIKGAKKPDGVISPAEALKKGECAFAYFPGARAEDSPERILVAAPLIPGTDRFDPKPFDGKALVLLLDGSVTFKWINNQGQAVLGGRKLLDPGDPAWGGRPVVIAWPDL